MNTKIAFIGGGKIAQALIDGFNNANFSLNKFIITAKTKNTLKLLSNKYPNSMVTDDNSKAKTADIIFLAVKPYHLQDIATDLNNLPKDTIIISTLAKTNIEHISNLCKIDSNQIALCMPNTAAAIKMGSFGILQQGMTDYNKEKVTTLLSSIGSCHFLSSFTEYNNFTSICGCGPAFVYYLMQAMQEECSNLKLNISLVQEIFESSAAMLKNNSKSPLELIQQVASKGGMTEKGISFLQKNTILEKIRQGLQKTKE